MLSKCASYKIISIIIICFGLHGLYIGVFSQNVAPTKLALQHSSLDFMVLFFVSPRKETLGGKSDMTTSDEAHPQRGGVKVSLLVG